MPLRPVGQVVGGRSETVEDDWHDVRAEIRLDGESLDGLNLHVADLDALSGSPILDIKPYLVEFAPRHPVTQPAWAPGEVRLRRTSPGAPTCGRAVRAAPRSG
ncbi:TrmO family methyltransferase domain-containing protein [Streptosporangium album]|uniref:TrmO family methyltransferase domain-containing protein n=1 Tax=Streptosporangium album TaxID=47479 RepID=UPI0031E6AAD5